VDAENRYSERREERNEEDHGGIPRSDIRTDHGGGVFALQDGLPPQYIKARVASLYAVAYAVARIPGVGDVFVVCHGKAPTSLNAEAGLIPWFLLYQTRNVRESHQAHFFTPISAG
jgi:hypothetical protein